MRSRRRGLGHDLAGARPYRPGDDIRTIDHRATAKLSSARNGDELVVREFLTEQSTRVVVVLDRSPSMSLFPAGLPWLPKPAAVLEAVRVILASARDSGCPAGLLECNEQWVWVSPDGHADRDVLLARAAHSAYDAPAASLGTAIGSGLTLERGLGPGTFVFVLSDFLRPLASEIWEAMLARRWDVVPVIIQDRVWEQSFPDVAGSLLAIADPETGACSELRLSAADVATRQAENEHRIAELRMRLQRFGLDWIELCSANAESVLDDFAAWALGRREGARTLR